MVKKPQAFLLNSGTSQDAHSQSFLFNIISGILTAVRQEKEVEGIQNGREEIKLPLCARDMIFHVEKPRASLVAQRVKHLPVMRKTQVGSLGQEDPLEKEMATHSSILAWRIPWTEEPCGLQSMGSQSEAWCAVIHGVAKSRT